MKRKWKYTLIMQTLLLCSSVTYFVAEDNSNQNANDYQSGDIHVPKKNNDNGDYDLVASTLEEKDAGFLFMQNKSMTIADGGHTLIYVDKIPP